jgi:glucose/arabinose dehydrogenase
MRLRLIVSLCLAALASGCEVPEWLQWQALRLYLAVNPNLALEDGPRAYLSESEDLKLVPVADDLELPWDLAFPSDAVALVTEKPGRLTRVDLATGALTRIRGVPEVAFVGQGGLLGLELDPAFASNGRLHLSYSVEREGGTFTTRLARARLDRDALVELEVLLDAEPALAKTNHFGGALEFDRAGLLYLSVGDRMKRDLAQDLGSHAGKILRLRPDGSVPDDNPFVRTPGAQPAIFSWGHRNPQGLALHPVTGELWSAEHGPKGGDEVNVIRAGRNYGWPIISYGEEYRGGKIGIGTHREGLEQPVHYWVPSIATAGLGFYSGRALASWTGNLFVAGLIGTRLDRLALDGERVVHQEALFADLWQRVRAVRESPSRELYVLTENGVLFRIEPAPRARGRGPGGGMSGRRAFPHAERRRIRTRGARVAAESCGAEQEPRGPTGPTLSTPGPPAAREGKRTLLDATASGARAARGA